MSIIGKEFSALNRVWVVYRWHIGAIYTCRVKGENLFRDFHVSEMGGAQ